VVAENESCMQAGIMAARARASPTRLRSVRPTVAPSGHSQRRRRNVGVASLLVLVEPAPVDAGLDDERLLSVIGDLFDVDGDADVVGRASQWLLEDRRAAERGERDVARGDD
jgi:hypothetical protein